MTENTPTPHLDELIAEASERLPRMVKSATRDWGYRVLTELQRLRAERDAATDRTRLEQVIAQHPPVFLIDETSVAGCRCDYAGLGGAINSLEAWAQHVVAQLPGAAVERPTLEQVLAAHHREEHEKRCRCGEPWLAPGNHRDHLAEQLRAAGVAL